MSRNDEYTTEHKTYKNICIIKNIRKSLVQICQGKKMYSSANQSIPQHINFTGKLENMMVQYSNAF